MDGQAVVEIAKLERDKKNWFQVPSEPKDVYYLVDEDGSPLKSVAEHLTPTVTCYSTAALLYIASKENETHLVQLYYSADKVQALVRETDGEERNRVHTLRLPLHPVFKLLEQLTATRKFDQRGLIRFLRAELNGNVGNAVIQQFRHLNLKVEGEGSAVVDKGRSGVSRSVMQSVGAKDDVIPDLITAEIPVYDIAEMLEMRYAVVILVDCLPNAEGQAVFELTTVYSGLQDARSRALEQIAESLSGHDLPIIYGEV